VLTADGKPAFYWNAKPWQVEFLDDPGSPVTGERCATRFVLRHRGEARATVELRPGHTDCPLCEADGPQLLWFVAVGRRKPRGYVFLRWALAAAMGLRRHNLYDNRCLDEWMTHGNVPAFVRLEELNEQRDRERDAAAARRRPDQPPPPSA
jgi:hypothetical protein